MNDGYDKKNKYENDENANWCRQGTWGVTLQWDRDGVMTV